MADQKRTSVTAGFGIARSMKVLSVGTYDGFAKPQGQTQEQLAFEAGLDLTYIGGIERGRRNPSLLAMARIATVLKVELEQLLALPSRNPEA